MPKTKLGWGKATTHAETLLEEGALSRAQHVELINKLYKSRHDQDKRISLALLKLFISHYPADFDRDFSLDDMISYGTTYSHAYWKNFGQNVLWPVLKLRRVPSIWIDRIADEESDELRLAFAVALEEMAKRKSIPLDRTLGMLRYFIDDPSTKVRERLVRVIKVIAERDGAALHYFLIDHDKNAGTYRTALFAAIREELGWEKSDK